MARIISLLKQTFNNISGEGPSNKPMTFVQTQATIQPKKDGRTLLKTPSVT
jgi:hypothetical protein